MMMLSTTLCGCTSVIVSSKLDQCASAPCLAPEGVIYSLPKGQFLLQASRLPVTAQTASAAATTLSTDNATVQKDLAAIVAANATLATDTAKPAAADVIAGDNANIANLTQGLANDQQILALAQASFNVAQAGLNQGIETFTLTQQAIAPDPAARYVANINHSVLRDDTMKIDVSNGLLTSATTTSVDQSLNALVSLAQTAISAATFISAGVPLIPPTGPAGAPPPPGAPPPVFPMECTYQYATMFDPLDTADVARVNGDLLAYHATIRVNPVSYSDGKKAFPIARSADAATVSSETKGTSGFVYRTPTTVIVTVEPVSGIGAAADPLWISNDDMWKKGGPLVPAAGGPPIQCPLQAKPPAVSQLAVVPDSRTQFVIHADAGAFTSTTDGYLFTSGMLTEYSTSKPSEVTAPVQALSTLAQNITAIPASILQLRINYATQADTLVKANTTLMTDRYNTVTAAYTAQTAIDNARSALVTAQFGGAQAWVAAQTALLKAQQALQALIQSSATGASSPSPGTTASPSTSSN
jgi:hypothetical protein